MVEDVVVDEENGIEGRCCTLPNRIRSQSGVGHTPHENRPLAWHSPTEEPDRTTNRYSCRQHSDPWTVQKSDDVPFEGSNREVLAVVLKLAPLGNIMMWGDWRLEGGGGKVRDSGLDVDGGEGSRHDFECPIEGPCHPTTLSSHPTCHWQTAHADAVTMFQDWPSRRVTQAFHFPFAPLKPFSCAVSKRPTAAVDIASFLPPHAATIHTAAI